VLTGPAEDVGPIAAIRSLWCELPAPRGAEQAGAGRPGCERIRDVIVELRQQLTPEVKNLKAPGVHNGSQTLVLWKNRQYAANRMRYGGGAADLKLEALGLAAGSPAERALAVPDDRAAFAKYEATFDRFCATFPDAFVVTERARVYLD